MPFPVQLPYPAQIPYPQLQPYSGTNQFMPTPPYPLSNSSEIMTAHPLSPYPSKAMPSIAPYPPFPTVGYGSSSEQNLSKPAVLYRQNSSLDRLNDPYPSQKTTPYSPLFLKESKPTIPYSSSMDSISVNLPTSVIELTDISSAPNPLPSAPNPTHEMSAPPPNFEESMKMLSNKKK